MQYTINRLENRTIRIFPGLDKRAAVIINADEWQSLVTTTINILEVRIHEDEDINQMCAKFVYELKTGVIND